MRQRLAFRAACCGGNGRWEWGIRRLDPVLEWNGARARTLHQIVRQLIWPRYDYRIEVHGDIARTCQHQDRQHGSPVSRLVVVGEIARVAFGLINGSSRGGLRLLELKDCEA